MTIPELNLVIMDDGWRNHAVNEAMLTPVISEIFADPTLLIASMPITLSLVLSDDAGVRTLNAQFRGLDKPTNVLSFSGELDHGELGDIVFARETIEREAEQQGKRFHDHFVHLVVHGCLHLCGHDHEDPHDAEMMETLEVAILKVLAIANPYEHQ